MPARRCYSADWRNWCIVPVKKGILSHRRCPGRWQNSVECQRNECGSNVDFRPQALRTERNRRTVRATSSTCTHRSATKWWRPRTRFTQRYRTGTAGRWPWQGLWNCRRRNGIRSQMDHISGQSTDGHHLQRATASHSQWRSDGYVSGLYKFIVRFRWGWIAVDGSEGCRTIQWFGLYVCIAGTVVCVACYRCRRRFGAQFNTVWYRSIYDHRRNRLYGGKVHKACAETARYVTVMGDVTGGHRYQVDTVVTALDVQYKDFCYVLWTRAFFCFNVNIMGNW